jgi:hypothetical protein
MSAFRWLLPASLGQTVVTANAEDRLEWPDVYVALRRHADTGRVESSRSARTLEGCRVLSAYHDRRGERFWVITEADHRTTLVLLPEEYGATRHGASILCPIG